MTGPSLEKSIAPLRSFVTEPLRFERVDDVPADRLHLGFRLPPDHTREFLVAEAAMDILAGLATSPVAPDAESGPGAVSEGRYGRIAERFGSIATDQLTSGQHVHVEVA